LPKSVGDEGRSDVGDESGTDVDTGKWSIWWSAMSTKVNNAPADDSLMNSFRLGNTAFITSSESMLHLAKEETRTREGNGY